jgi:antitoxin component YwqK of YwqJK toxin-antitoxin module
MKLACTILFIAALLGGKPAMAQKAEGQAKHEPINQVDERGRKNGMWYFHTAARMGEVGTSEFGHYDHGRKIGNWYKVDGDGELISVEMYKNNVLDGEVKYYDKGLLSCVGHYRGLNPSQEYDSIIVVDPTTNEQLMRVIPTDRGTLRHGTWKYYEPVTGRLLKEEDYQVDELVYSKEYMMTKTDSLNYQKQVQNLPHNKKEHYKPPVKPVSYLND